MAPKQTALTDDFTDTADGGRTAFESARPFDKPIRVFEGVRV